MNLRNYRKYWGFTTIAIAMMAFALAWWKAQFGLDLTDEGFYLAPAFKLFALGDRPFLDEVFNGPRHSDFLNFLFLASWAPFSVLFLRRLAVLVFALILWLFLRRAHQKSFPPIAALTFSAVLLFDMFAQPTWSYNAWVRNALLLHTILLFGSPGKIHLFFAGSLLGLAVIAYQPILIPALLSMAIVFILQKKHGGFSFRKSGLYLLGFFLALLPDLIFLAQGNYFLAWWNSIQMMNSLSDYSGESRVDKLRHILGYLFSRTEFWIGVALFAPPPRRISRWIYAAGLIYLGTRFWKIPDVQKILAAWVGWGAAAALALAIKYYRRKNFTGVYSVLILSLGAIAMAMASANGHWALFWLLPSVGAWCIAENYASWGRLARTLVIALLAFLIGGGAWDMVHRTYHDVAPLNADQVVDIAPWRGIRTSSRRAQILFLLDREIGNYRFSLAFPSLPGIFLIRQVRQSTNTIFVDLNAPEFIHRLGFQRMTLGERFPNLIIRAKTHPWTWGISSTSKIELPVSHPYFSFLKCTGGKILLDLEEVIVIKPEKIKCP